MCVRQRIFSPEDAAAVSGLTLAEIFESMSLIMKTITMLTSLVLCIACKKTESYNANFIEVFAIRPGLHFPMSLDCGWNGKPQNSEIGRYYKINDPNFTKSFIDLYKNYKETGTSNSIDVRFTVLVHQSKKVDTLCMGENWSTYLNGKEVNDLPKIFKLLKTQIEYGN